MLLIVGLGNPGRQYENTRHNVGFMAVDSIARSLSFSSFSENNKFKGEIATGEAFGDKTILLKPITYMNLSGEAVGAVASYYKIPLEKIVVIHDDIDLKLGDVRIKRGGGHAGHNGLRSIDAHIGKDYFRIRIGVGRPQDKEDVANYVLQHFSKDEMVDISEVLCDIEKIIQDLWLPG